MASREASQKETEMLDRLNLSVGRDYSTSSKYEFVIFYGDEIVLRKGGFKTAAAARRAGLAAAKTTKEY